MSGLLKRGIDIVASAVALVVLLPLLVVLVLWIWFDSPGRIFFMQRRLGRDRQEFRVVKFRTMVERDPDAIDQRMEQVISEGKDPRITRSGRFLRKTSLDELPQLWNILRGDMSLVGPRPVLPEQLAAIPLDALSRFDVRPGLTGLAQVRGRRSLGWLQQLAADAEYVQSQSLWSDIVIVVRTFHVVLTGSGIYGDTAVNWRNYVPKGDKVGRD